MTEERLDRWLPAGAFLFSLALYIATLAPGVVGGDPGEHQFAPYLLGITHRTGYPLYMLLGKLWSFLPIGSVAYRMNLLSALFAALSVSLVYLITRNLTNQRGSALIATLALAFSPLFWEWATIAGVRSLNALFIGLIIYLALLWQERREDRYLYILAATCGLSLAHHRTTLLILPPLLLFLLLEEKSVLTRGRRLLTLMGLLLLPLLLYLYLPIRSAMNPPYAWIKIEGLEDFLDLALAYGTAGRLRALDWGDFPHRIALYLTHLHRQFSPLEIALGCLGALILLVRRPKALSLLSLSFLGLVAFTIDWYFGHDKLNPVFLIPSHMIFAIWIGIAAGSLIDWGGNRLGRRAGRPFSATMIALFLLLLWQKGLTNLQAVIELGSAPLDNFRQELRGQQAPRFVLSSLPHVEPNSIILCDWEQFSPLHYYQLVEHLRPDVELHYGLDDWAQWLEKGFEENRSVYISRALPEIIGKAGLTNLGPLIEMQEAPTFQAPSYITKVEANLEDKMKLVGYAYLKNEQRSKRDEFRRGEILQLMLYWKALTKLDRDYSISVRLYDSADHMVAQRDSHHPVLSTYPTKLWREGEVVGDYYELPLKPEFPPGQYHVEVLVYTSEGPGKWHNLSVLGQEANLEHVRLHPINVR